MFFKNMLKVMAKVLLDALDSREIIVLLAETYEILTVDHFKIYWVQKDEVLLIPIDRNESIKVGDRLDFKDWLTFASSFEGVRSTSLR